MIGEPGLTTAQVATYGGGSSAVFFGLTANETAAAVGAIVAVIGLVMQCWYTLDKRARAVEMHRAELEALRNGGKTLGQRVGEDA